MPDTTFNPKSALIVVDMRADGAAREQQVFEYGCHATVPTDAVSDLEANKHEHRVAHHFPPRAEAGSTEDLSRLPSIVAG